jgi:hypothetical protein
MKADSAGRATKGTGRFGASVRPGPWATGALALAAALTLTLGATGCCRGKSSSSSTSGETPPSGGVGIGTGTYAAGQLVDVNWNGSWWQCRVLSRTGNLYRIHYLGWASSWDENVTTSRMRAFSGKAKRGSGPD